MIRCIFTVIFSMMFYLGFSQTYGDYKKLLNKNKSFYIEKVNIWMLINSDFIEVKSWKLKKIEIVVLPEEGFNLLLEEEKEQLSKFEQDSILIKNWKQSIYNLSIVVNKTTGEQEIIHYFLTPNGDLLLYGEHFSIWRENSKGY